MVGPSINTIALHEFFHFKMFCECTKFYDADTPLGVILNHLKKIHGWLGCDVCHTAWKTSKEYVNHLFTKRHKSHEALTLADTCSNCGYLFPNPARLRDHYQLCATSSIFECCGIIFNTRSSLCAHLSTHKRSYEINCFVCHKKVSLVHYAKHQKAEHTENICRYCGVYFRNVWFYRYHRQRDTAGVSICDGNRGIKTASSSEEESQLGNQEGGKKHGDGLETSNACDFESLVDFARIEPCSSQQEIDFDTITKEFYNKNTEK